MVSRHVFHMELGPADVRDEVGVPFSNQLFSVQHLEMLIILIIEHLLNASGELCAVGLGMIF
jgi:hypothetical protein